ncbi:MAG: LysR family transcriptional regulator [Alteromonadaceae bacterium]|nr:LysR family transcriptional regulator [Alteromonadaceae bacterium]
MNLNRIDLNLFAVFDAIYTAGNLTRAADILCITQPAVSNSLARLRDLLDDPLFVRTGHVMTPTPVAQNLIVPARQALDLLRNSVLHSREFNPATAEKIFQFACRDLIEASILPRLIANISAQAPFIAINNYDVDKKNVLNALAGGQLDFYTDSNPITDPYLVKHIIAEDRLVVVGRPGHPAFDSPLTLDSFLSYSHINVTPRQGEPCELDIELSRLGQQRRIVMQSHHFLTIPSVLVKTDLLACLPYHLAKHYDLAVSELPFTMQPLNYYLYWHVSANEDPAHRWVREQLLAISQSFRANTTES